jgi:hypothetical protein
MTTPVEVELRRRLRQLANQPGPPSLADQALAGARRVRRWRTCWPAAARCCSPCSRCLW